jgi:acyl-CoA synthetase (AMP-forming)/AMP-acid ligase II
MRLSVENTPRLSVEYEAAVDEPVARHLNDCLARIGVNPLSVNVLDAVVTLPDAYLQLTAPGFELPRRNLPASVHFVGAVPITQQVKPRSCPGRMNWTAPAR